MDTALNELKGWIGRSETVRDQIGATPVKALDATWVDAQGLCAVVEVGADSNSARSTIRHASRRDSLPFDIQSNAAITAPKLLVLKPSP